jgi:hypothetical protein
LRDVGDKSEDFFVKRRKDKEIRKRLAGSKVDYIIDYFKRNGEAKRVRGYIPRVNPGRCTLRNLVVTHVFSSRDSYIYIEI